MKESPERHSDESGEIMIESTIIVLMTTFILIFMVSLGFLFYQKSIMNTVANETVAELSQMYKYPALLDEDITSQTDMLAAMDSLAMYRYAFNWGTLEAANVQKVLVYPVIRLSKTSLATQEGVPTIELHAYKSDFGRRYIEVSIEAKYSIFWGGALEAFGMEETYIISSTAYGECNDISNYYNTVNYITYLGKIAEDDPVIGAIDSMLSLYKDING